MVVSRENLEKYAKLSVASGTNIQPGQILVIRSSVDCVEFTRLAAAEAYKLGAKEVVVQWSDENCSKLDYMYCSDETLSDYPDWKVDSMLDYAKKGAAYLSISASDPDLLKEVDPKKVALAFKSRSAATKEFSKRLMSDQNAWSIVAIPSKPWAKKVFPDLDTDEAVEKLWNEIFKIVRVDQPDPVEAWNAHMKNLKSKIKYLNDKNFKALHYENSLGTDLTVELVDNHIWGGGSEASADGVEFIANMPTEEVFTMPKATGINGKVVSTKPLSYHGSLINNFSFTFKGGRVVNFTAEQGYDVLKELLDTDEGARSLGEAALVPFDSPISNSNIIFYNTLFDENASCHLALGAAYSMNITGGDKMNDEEKAAAGFNDSLIHVDFMIGSADLKITGICHDGSEVAIFENGNWAV